MSNQNAERVTRAYIDSRTKRDEAVRDAAEAILEGRCTRQSVIEAVNDLATILDDQGEVSEDYMARWRKAEARVETAFAAWCDA